MGKKANKSSFILAICSNCMFLAQVSHHKVVRTCFPVCIWLAANILVYHTYEAGR
jgi:hypothetical protein